MRLLPKLPRKPKRIDLEVFQRHVTVRQIEAGQTAPRRATLVVVRQAFERGGVEFIDENGGGSGVRLRKRQGAKKPK
jgi:hypothetical protein